MLNRFRQGGLVQLMMGGVVLLIIAAFTFDARQKPTSLDTECVVRVGKDCVPPRDFNSTFRLSVSPEISAKELKRLGVRKMVLDGLVERQLLLREADRLGISIGDEDLDRELSLGRFHFSMPAERSGQLDMLTVARVTDPKTDRFNFKIYERSVRNYARMSTKDFKVNQREELTAARMRDLVRSGVRVSDDEAFAHFQHTRSKATVRVAQLSTEWFTRYAPDLPETAVEAYAGQHPTEVDEAFEAVKERYVEGCPLVSEIFFAHPPAADASDEAATRARAERVLSQARGNSAERFAALAREHGGTASALHGGRRGCLHESEGDETKELLAALEPIRPGGLSSLIELPGGFHLLRLEQRLSADRLVAVGKLQVARPLAEQAEGERRTAAFAQRLREAVAGGQAMQSAIGDLAASTLSDAGVAGDLAKAALDSRERPQVEVSASFTRTGALSPIPGALDETAARQVAFTLSRVGDVFGEPIPTLEGLAVLQLKELEPATRAQFDEEKADFVRDFRQQVQLDALVAYVETLRTAANEEIEMDARYLEDTEKASDDS